MRGQLRLRRFVTFLGCLTVLGIARDLFAVCADGIVEVGEQCDNGGTCIGGSRAGSACEAESDCSDGGACFGGLDDLRACESDGECRLGRCLRCRPRGGDGCAANCTFEAEVPLDLVDGVTAPGSLDITFGTSGGTFFSPILTVPVVLAGAITFTAGGMSGDVAPVTVAAGALRVPGIIGSSIFCACMRAVPASTCGGTLLDADGSFSADCTLESPTAVQCPAEKPCATIHGTGNAGSGFLSRGARGANLEAGQDCTGEPGGDPFPPRLSVHDGDDPTAGSDAHGLIGLSTATGMVIGSCRDTRSEYGPDGEFCTDDDPVSSRGKPRLLLLTTASASGIVENPGDFEGDVLGPYGANGRAFSSNDGRVDMSTGILGTVFTECDLPIISDVVVRLSFALAAPSSPTPSPTPTFPTPTPTRTPTRTLTPTPRVVVRVPHVEVGCDPPTGTRFSVDIALGGEGVAGVQNDLIFDNTIVDIDITTCRINPAIGLFPLGPAPATSCLEDNTIGACKSLAILRKTCIGTSPPEGCPAGAGSNISVITALIAGTATLNNVAMPEGLLYTCEAAVINGVAFPTTLGVSRVIASDGAGRRIPVRAVSGSAGGSCPPPTPTALPIGFPCGGADECDSGYCIDATCCATASCSPQRFCNISSSPGFCSERHAIGEGCETDHDCMSLHCVFGQSGNACAAPRTPTPVGPGASCDVDPQCGARFMCNLSEGGVCCDHRECPAGSSCRLPGYEGFCSPLPTATKTPPGPIGRSPTVAVPTALPTAPSLSGGTADDGCAIRASTSSGSRGHSFPWPVVHVLLVMLVNRDRHRCRRATGSRRVIQPTE